MYPIEEATNIHPRLNLIKLGEVQLLQMFHLQIC